MKESILISVLAICLLACSSSNDNKSTGVEDADSSMIYLKNHKSERFFPEIRANKRFDTLIAEKQLEITIIQRYLGSYVVNEYENNGKRQVDKYRDAEIALTIKQKSRTLLDTVLRKEQFLQHAEKEFCNVTIFHGYWLDKFSESGIELSGSISKPETDWAIDFHHYFDLTSKTLNFKPNTNDEE